jgi:hypothetical protein
MFPSPVLILPFTTVVPSCHTQYTVLSYLVAALCNAMISYDAFQFSAHKDQLRCVDITEHKQLHLVQICTILIGKVIAEHNLD